MEGIMSEEKCALVAELVRVLEMVRQLEEHMAGQQQQQGGVGGAAAGGDQRCRALVCTMRDSIDRAVHMAISPCADGRGVGQPESPPSGGDGSPRSGGSDQGGEFRGRGNAAGLCKKRYEDASQKEHPGEGEHRPGCHPARRRPQLEEVRAEGHPRRQVPKSLLPVHVPAHAELPREQAGAAHGRRPAALRRRVQRRPHVRPGAGRRRAPRRQPPGPRSSSERGALPGLAAACRRRGADGGLPGARASAAVLAPLQRAGEGRRRRRRRRPCHRVPFRVAGDAGEPGPGRASPRRRARLHHQLPFGQHGGDGLHVPAGRRFHGEPGQLLLSAREYDVPTSTARHTS